MTAASRVTFFAREAAAVFAANGITAYLYPRLEPVPALSFAVRHLHCGLGICVTASHNPAAYNGYKVYGSDGCQMTPEAAKRVVALLEQMDYFTAARTEDFDAALAAGRIRYIPDEVLDAFVDAVYAQRVGSGDGIADLKLVYTPLNGAGLECVRKLTQKLGIRNMTIVKEQEQPDGHFPTCPYPNPEIRQAMELGLQYCDRVHPDILIGTDPDCDRCGTAVPDGKGGYRLISGNEMGVILLDFICRSRIANGTMPENPVAVTTIVSTDMVTAVANKYGVELRRVLTGFKYIGEQIALLEAGGHPERYIFGFEESYGYLSGPHVRDKDAVNAVLLICEAAAWYAKKGYDARRRDRRALRRVRLLLQRAEELHLRRRDRHGEDGVADVRPAHTPAAERRGPAGRGALRITSRTAPACRRPTCSNTACPAAQSSSSAPLAQSRRSKPTSAPSSPP